MGENFRLRLYVAGNSINSALAVANIKTLCQKHLRDRHQIEIVDVFVEPQRAMADGVLLTPMLVKVSPEPRCRIVGTLGDHSTVIHSLGIET